jgi:hypothetical protein
MLRRTSWHYYEKKAAELAVQAATWMGEELGWNGERVRWELDRYFAVAEFPCRVM